MLQDLCNVVASSAAIAVHGGCTKNGLLSNSATEGRVLVDSRPLDGIVTYDPSEFFDHGKIGNSN